MSKLNSEAKSFDNQSYAALLHERVKHLQTWLSLVSVAEMTALAALGGKYLYALATSGSTNLISIQSREGIILLSLGGMTIIWCNLFTLYHVAATHKAVRILTVLEVLAIKGKTLSVPLYFNARSAGSFRIFMYAITHGFPLWVFVFSPIIYGKLFGFPDWYPQALLPWYIRIGCLVIFNFMLYYFVMWPCVIGKASRKCKNLLERLKAQSDLTDEDYSFILQ